jgi:hypothetical protein
MPILVNDCLNTQFKLYTYLSTVNDTVIEYLENNNLNINYYCCAFKIINKIRHIIISNTTKNIKTFHKLITIEFIKPTTNNIIINNNQLVITYQNIKIKTLQKVDNFLFKFKNEENEQLSDKKLYFNCFYDKNISELDVKIIKNYSFEHNLLLFTNLKSLTLSDDYNQIIKPNKLPKCLKKITFGPQYSQIINSSVLPSTIKAIVFKQSIKIDKSIYVPTEHKHKIKYKEIHHRGGGLMQLVAYGAQEAYISNSAPITFFKVSYRRKNLID